MSKKISNSEQLTTFIKEISIKAPIPVQEMLKCQLEIVSLHQKPTFVNSTLSNMIQCLHTALKECDNDKQKDSVRLRFTKMIETFITLLDARIVQFHSDNHEAGVDAITKASNLMFDNLRDSMLMAVNTFGAGVKATASVVDHSVGNIEIMVTGLATMVGEGVAGTPVSVSQTMETSGEGDSLQIKETQTVEKGSASDQTIETMRGTGKDTMDILNENIGDFSKTMGGITDDWTNSMNGIILNNVFSEEHKEDRTNIMKWLLSFPRKRKEAQQMLYDFYKIICETIDTLDKYYEMIGKSVLISDMIERYVKVLKSNMKEPDSLAMKTVKFLLQKGAVLSPYLVKHVGLGPVAGLVAYSIFENIQSQKGFIPEKRIDEYLKVADKYSVVSDYE